MKAETSNTDVQVNRSFMDFGAMYPLLLNKRRHSADLMVGVRLGNGPIAEFAIRWHNMDGVRDPIPKLEVFSDAWHVLPYCGDLLRALAERGTSDVCQMRRLLLELGFQDRTVVPPQAPVPCPTCGGAINGRNP